MIISVLFFLLFSIKVNATDACPAFESALIQSTEKVQKKLSQEEIEAALRDMYSTPPSTNNIKPATITKPIAPKVVKKPLWEPNKLIIEDSKNLSESLWWKEIKKRADPTDYNHALREETKLLQKKAELINQKIPDEKNIAKIEEMIESSSSSLRDSRSMDQIMKEYGEMLHSGGSAPMPKSPADLRKWRKEASSFANERALEAQKNGEKIFTEDFVKTIYGKMMGEDPKSVLYRRYQPIIGGKTISGQDKRFVLMPVNEVAPAMKEFLKDLQIRIEQKADPIDTAIWIERTLVSIHPFIDGNGRITREIASTYLKSQGLPRPLFLKGEELSFAILPDKEFPMQTYEAIKKIYQNGIERHLKLLSE